MGQKVQIATTSPNFPSKCLSCLSQTFDWKVIEQQKVFTVGIYSEVTLSTAKIPICDECHKRSEGRYTLSALCFFTLVGWATQSQDMPRWAGNVLGFGILGFAAACAVTAVMANWKRPIKIIDINPDKNTASLYFRNDEYANEFAASNPA